MTQTNSPSGRTEDDARWPERAFLFDYDLQDEAGDWKTLRGWSESTPAPMQSKEYIRADLEATASLSIATQPDLLADPRVTALLDALQVYADGCDATETTPCGYDGNMCCMTARTALAAFDTTDKPQGANNEVKGGKDE